ncbi:tRNA pseudouridylate synthase [Tieghemostelium lacteum]|uniref:tRNA pseudouridylate synthase n=1 Tax=Tieghemostelium lacteum TaxID=361077 RepID=A0A151Z3E3_TIELA|nr:tRNA pseudouridylate synthase [Tieghemostelium lacteum]|eukprot:KYQ88482.1 tRNA pseudouridylate synthase [Tieghemostelium lacteum]
MEQLTRTKLESYTKDELIDYILSEQKKNSTTNTSTKKEKKNKRNQNEMNFDKFYKRYIALKVAYIGWDYHGFAAQSSTEETIEAYLFKALQKTCLISDIKSANYSKSGRTDKGVSAFGQVISLYVRSNLSEGAGTFIPPISPSTDTTKNNNNNSSTNNNNMKNNQQKQLQKKKEEFPFVKMLNGVLPPFIRVLAWAPIEFHFSARFSTLYRTYKYYFNPEGMDINLMKQASKYYVGEHDFSNFCKMDPENVKSFVRVVLSFEIEPQGVDSPLMVATIRGYAFLWHQIRCLMGMLFLIGQKKLPLSIVPDLLDLSKGVAKPPYEMASEVPLVLFDCGYEDLQFEYDITAQQKLHNNFFQIWNDLLIKSSVVNLMKLEYQKLSNYTPSSNINSDNNKNNSSPIPTTNDDNPRNLKKIKTDIN